MSLHDPQRSAAVPPASSSMSEWGHVPPSASGYSGPWGFDGAASPGMTGNANGEAFFQSLRRHWLVKLLIGVAGALGAGGAVWMLMPAKYTAQALVHVASHTPRGVFSGYESNDDFAAFQRTQATLLKSRLVIQTALRQPQIAELTEIRDQTDAAGWLGENLLIDSTLGPEVLRVSLSGNQPDDLPLIINAVVAAYFQEISGKDRASQLARVKQLEENYRRFEDALRLKRSLLRNLENTLGVEDPKTLEIRFQSALQQLAAAEKECLQIKLAGKNAQTEWESEKTKVTKPPGVVVSELAIDEYLRQDLGYQRLLTRLLQLEEEIGRTKIIAAPGARNNLLEGPMSQQTIVEKALAARRREVRPLVAAQIQEKSINDFQINLAKLESRVSMLQVQEKGMDGEVKRLEGQVKRLNAAIRQPDKPTSDLQALRDEVLQTEQILKKVSDQLDTLKVEPVVPGRVSLLEAADVPQSKNLDRQIKTTAMVGLGAFCLVVFGVSWREFRTRRVYTEADVVQGLGLNLVGTLPALPLSARRALAGSASRRDLRWQALLTESVDAIRTQLLYAAQKDSLKVIMVTSAMGGEGKTSVASHLATSLARAGRKTLLVDGDLRNPGAHRQFDLSLEPGFCELLRGEIKMEEAIRPTPLPRLSVITAGHWNLSANEALAREEAGIFFHQCEEEFDFVIVDSSPVLPVADALLLGQHADGVILSVLRDVSRIPSIYAAQQRLAPLGIRLLGTVVIGAGGDLNGATHHYPRQLTQ